MTTPDAPGLKKALTPLHLWALAVGLVVSGEYFGWNYGWAAAGPVGFLVATLVVTVLYVAFVFSFTELTTALPSAGGPFAYAHRAFGPVGGLVAGYATLVEFLFAPPAIAFALGSYGHFLVPGLPVLPTALGCFATFTLLNLLGIKESATFSLVVTVLAVGELLLYLGLVAPHFRAANFLAHPVPLRAGGVLAALPFAVWFYLAIEGVALVAEEVRDPRRTIPRGYGYGLGTLVALALGVMVCTGGVGDWRALARLDYPLPAALGVALGPGSRWARLFASIGVFGLVASLHGTVIGYSRQVFALARAGYLPGALARLNGRRSPHWALAAGGAVGGAALLTGTTDQVIVLSVLGALAMYVVSLLSLFALRRREPGLARPFAVPGYPGVPLLALALSLLSLGALVYFNLVLSGVFLAGLLGALGLFLRLGRHRGAQGAAADNEELTATMRKLCHFWQRQAGASAPVAAARVPATPMENGAVLPPDFAQFYRSAGGRALPFPEDTDEAGFHFLPAKELRTEHRQLLVVTAAAATPEQAHVTVLVDYMQSSWEYGFIPDAGGPGYRIGIMAGGDEFKIITASLAEFLRLYMENAAVLYDWRNPFAEQMEK